METDEMELDTIGDRKTALFVIISDTDDTFNFVVSILYTQLFNLLCDKADDVYGGRLPVHVRCLLAHIKRFRDYPQCTEVPAPVWSGGKNNTENRIFVSTNIRISSSLSIAHFIHKRLYILFTGNPHSFGYS